MTPTDISALQGESGLQVLTVPGGEIAISSFNTSLAPGSDFAVRKAAALSIDRHRSSITCTTARSSRSVHGSAGFGTHRRVQDLYGDRA